VRILLVEDDPLIREFVVEALREEGYQVIHAGADDRSSTFSSRTSSCPEASTDGRSPNAAVSMIPNSR
jgi:DNA-binding response OmpR family regulator